LTPTFLAIKIKASVVCYSFLFVILWLCVFQQQHQRFSAAIQERNKLSTTLEHWIKQ
jgi:hypothetical protein